jgi:hypothetical protein
MDVDLFNRNCCTSFRVMPNFAIRDAQMRIRIAPCTSVPSTTINVGGVPGPGGVRISVTDQEIGAQRPTITRDRILAPATSYGSVFVISSNDAVRLTLFASGHRCPRLPVGR